jgi:hypothetical protein
MCAIRLQPRGEHIFLGWPLSNLCLQFNMKFQMKAMCFPMRAIITTMNLGVVVNVVNNHAWDKATT